MGDREDLQALRRLAELEAKASGIDPTEGMGGIDKFRAGMGKAFYDVGRGVGQLTGAVSQQDVDAAKARDKALMQTGAGVAGNVVGNVAALLPTAAIPGVNTVAGGAALGAGLGAIQPVASDESRLTNVGLGAAGGAGGQAAANLIGRLSRPVQSSLKEPLASLATKAETTYGIPLNAAQRTGSKPLAIISSVLENMPLTAERQALEKDVQRRAFNAAVLKSIGETADQATPDVLNAARTRIGGQFNALSGRNTVNLGNDFLNSLATVDASRTVFSSPKITDAVEKGLDLASKGNITGAEYQKIRTVLGKASGDAFKSGNSELGQALKSIKGALDDAATASVSAADKNAWNVARQQWQSLNVLEKAAAPTSADAVKGNISPAKLAQALQSIDKKGYTYGTRGDELSDLARIGQAFIKEQIPDSGTAQRAFYQRFLENPMSAAWQGATGGIALPVQALVNSKAGQAYFGQGPASPQLLRLARILRQSAGMTGAALPVGLANTE